MRVYVPLTVPGLLELQSRGRLSPAPMAAHAVTPALRRAWEGADDEELEYAALMAAAYDSLVLIGARGADPRRIVVAADVADADVLLGDDDTAVQVTAEVPLALCGAVHVDDSDAAGQVAEAVRRLPAAQAGDGDALAAVALVEHELLWFATQEIPDVLA